MGSPRILVFVVALLLIGVGLLFFVMPLLGVNLAVSQPRPVPSITILEHSGAVDTRSGTYVVRGTAKNTGTVAVVKVYIVVTTYDGSGAEIGSSYDALLNLNPGDEVQFQVEARPYYNGVKVARYNIIPDLNYVPQL
jgi:hypothetical protein